MSRIGIFIAALLVAGSVCAQEFKSSMVEEKRAAILRGEYVTETGARTILHSWSIESGQVDDALNYLNKYTSTKNRMQTNTVTYTANDINSKRFAGTWVLVNVSWDLADVETGVGLLVRQLKRLVSADTLAELAAADNVVQENNEIVEPFNFKTGESDRKALVWVSLNPGSKSAVMALSDASLVTQFASGWTYVGRAWDNQPDGTAQFSLAFQKMAWNAWSNTDAADITQWSSVSGNRTGVSRTWLSIQNADLSSATTDCKSGNGGVAADSGYFIANVTIANRSDGAFNITQTQTEQLSNDTVTASEVLNPHSLCEGTRTRTTITYSGYADTNSVPNPAGYVPGTDAGVIANGLTGPDGQGMYGRTIITETTSWGAWASEATNTYDFIFYKNKDRTGEERTKIWCGIQTNDKATAEANLWSAAWTDSGFIVVGVDTDDNKNGSLTLTQQQVQTNLTDMSTSKTISAFSTQTSKTDERMTSAIVDQTNQVAGTVVTTKNSVDQYGLNTHSYSTNAATADPEVTITTTMNAFSSNYTVTAVNETNREDAVTNQTAGVIESASSTETDHGRFNNKRSTDTALKNITSSYTRAYGVLSDQEAETVANQTTSITTGTEVTNGIITSTTSTLNKHKLYDNKTATDTANQNVMVRNSRKVTAFGTNDAITVQNQTTATYESASVSDGVITSITSEKNKHDLYNNTANTASSAQDVDIGSDVSKDEFNTLTVFKTVGATGEVSNLWSTGTDYTLRTSNTKGEDGLYRTTVNSNEFNNVTNATVRTTATAFYSDRSVTVKHAASSLDDVTAVISNKVYTRTSRKDPTGKWDTTESERTPIYVSYTSSQQVSEFGGVTATRFHNTNSLPSVDTISGTNVESSVTASKNPFGLYDGAKQTQWHSGATNVSGGNFEWTELGPGKYWISLVFDSTNIITTTWYYEAWLHKVTLYNTREDAWDARDDEDHDPNLAFGMSVGRFAPGLYYYHRKERAPGSDEEVSHP